jgi:type II secretory pathway pseudopilin PulG
MRTRARSEMGETLVEVLFAIVIIGIIVSVFFSALVTSSTASRTHRDLVSADTVLRDYAEATKAAVRADCTASGSHYTVGYTPADTNFVVGSTPSMSSPGPLCPVVTAVQPEHLTVTWGGGSCLSSPPVRCRSLDILVRAP